MENSPSFIRVSSTQVRRTSIKCGIVTTEIVEGPQFQILAFRQKHGLSQSQFAKLINSSVRTLQEWEQGRKKVKGSLVVLLEVLSDNSLIAIELIDKKL